MDVRKVISDTLPSCYAVARLTDEHHDYLLVASEVKDSCFAYDVNDDFKKQIVWDTVGGTMSIVQIPGTMDFLATQRFYPGFDAKDCQIVYGQFKDGNWIVKPLCDFPYLHRFDLILDNSGDILFVGCTIANSKAYVEDWSDSGKIFVGRFDTVDKALKDISELPLRLLKNHGYYAVKEEGYSLITAVEGVVKLTYPSFSDTGDWRLDILFAEETSDIVQIDLNQDGKKENILIQGFHGDRLRVLTEDFSTELYHHPKETPFGHAIWSGQLLGQKGVVFGFRSGEADLLWYPESNTSFKPIMLDASAASSNVLAFEKEKRAYVFSANNGRGEVALYELGKGE
ncbi:hypothetical protein [Streptococcus sp. zg-JUN1979]|uniref:hypothetical protein n=1 Tax=Streptococcus sp. zg-JUN1979 TaxID=3391450 RepID=UPI0039A5D159